MNMTDPRRTRADGEKSRERLLHAAVRLFAEQGYDRTSTREIALAAQTNVAAIAYYFGDKAGLYRAAFRYGSPAPTCQAQPDLPLLEALRGFYRTMTAPLTQDPMARLCVRLVFREMLEPTGLWKEEIDSAIKPAHTALSMLLCRELGLAAPNDDVARLAFCLVGLVMHLMLVDDVVQNIRPSLAADAAAIEAWAERAAYYGVALVEAEKARMATTDKTPRKRTRKAP